MVTKSRVVWLAVWLCSATNQALANDSVSLASWNIEFLSGEALVEIKEGVGVARVSSDYQAIRRYLLDTQADVIALQEVGDIEALHTLFAGTDYSYYLSGRAEDPERRNEKDIFTAIAVSSRKVTHTPPQELKALSLKTRSGNQTRSGILTDIFLRGDYLFTFVSVHLKSGCDDTQKISTRSRGSCKIFYRQIKTIKEYIKKNPDKYFVFAGDFNRYIQREKNRKKAWNTLGEISPNENTARLVPEYSKTYCPTRQRSNSEPIDFFIAFPAYRFEFSNYAETWYTEKDRAMGVRLSNHCPISVELRVVSSAH